VLVISVCALEVLAHEKTFTQVRLTLFTAGLALPLGLWLLRRAPSRIRNWVIAALLLVWVSSAALIFIAIDQPAVFLRILRWLHGR
jgi:hypothetical protein